MGEENRPVDSSASVTADRSSDDVLDNVTRNSLARIYRSRAVTKKPVYTVPSPLDSDGTLGDSDSSEEIHYGPGFVSRLKSRYMSVALRSSSRTGAASLRRTASLENFLDKDKDEDPVEMRKSSAASKDNRHSDSSAIVGGMYAKKARVVAAAPTSSHIHRAKTRRRESMQRAQSVEVLSVNEPPSPPSEGPFVRNEFVQTDPDDDDLPPPLPPKAEKQHIDAVINSLGNDNITIVDKTRAKTKKNLSESEILPDPQSVAAETGSSGIRRPQYKRRSSSLLFGVEEKELPAPDTVKETRKIFESRSGGPSGRKPGPFTYRGLGLGHKSKSTSNLYQTRSQSVDRASPSSPAASPLPLVRKQSDENLHHHQRRSSSPSISAEYVSQVRGRPSAIIAKPILPTKPPHLSSPSPKSAATYAPFHPLKTAESKQAAVQQPPLPARASSTFPIPPLRPVSKLIKNVHTNNSSANQVSQERKADDNVEKRKKKEGTDVEGGVKRVSNDSIDRIRQGGSSVSFNFREQNGDVKRPSSDSALVENGVGRQVGVIRPITREKANNQTNETKNKLEEQREKEVLYIEKDPLPVPVKSWMAIAEAKKQSQKNQKTPEPALPTWVRSREESIVVTAEPAVVKEVSELPVRDDPVRSNAVVNAPIASSASTPVPIPVSAPAPDSSSPPPLPISTKRSETKAKSSSPPPNGDGSDIKSGSYRDDWKKRNSEKNTMVFNFVNSEKEVTHIENDGRDVSRRVKAASKRSKNGKEETGVILLLGGGGGGGGSASTDGDEVDDDNASDSEDSDIDVHRPVSPCKFTFIGANVATGKSSLRSKGKLKKLSITFSASLTATYEYPSFEAASHFAKEEATLKSNSSVGSKGGLGSYTPSKIQMSEAPFQLGVSRRSTPAATPNGSTSDDQKRNGKKEAAPEEVLRPIEDATSWSGSSSTSDLLF